MRNDGKYRVEQKYIISSHMRDVFIHNVSAIMDRDSNSCADGFYTVNSLYFDDIYDTAAYCNNAGLDDREKWRIRIYNYDKSNAKLECKQKYHDRCHKDYINITYDEMMKIIGSKDCKINRHQDALLNRFSALQKTRGLTPVSVIKYKRYAFHKATGNVRITFDCDISYSNMIESFFEKEDAAQRILPEGYDLMEIKYDTILPEYISRAVTCERVQRTAFSKYYLSRIQQDSMPGWYNQVDRLKKHSIII